MKVEYALIQPTTGAEEATESWGAIEFIIFHHKNIMTLYNVIQNKTTIKIK